MREKIEHRCRFSDRERLQSVIYRDLLAERQIEFRTIVEPNHGSNTTTIIWEEEVEHRTEYWDFAGMKPFCLPTSVKNENRQK